MMIPNEDGTYQCGPLDALLILHHEDQGTYHPALFYERLAPGHNPEPEDVETVRLWCKFHHTVGFGTLDEAATFLRENMAKKFLLHPECVRPDWVVSWDGELGVKLLVPNWRAQTLRAERSGNDPQ